MGVWTASWAPGLFVEAQKFWLYSISLGIVIGFVQLYELYMMPSILPAEKDDEIEDKEGEESKKGKQEAKRKLKDDVR